MQLPLWRLTKKLGVQAKVEAATPHELVFMLLRGASTKLGEAKVALRKLDIASKGESASKAIAIIDYLRASLEPGADRQFSERLSDLYAYMGRRVLEANAQNDEQGFVEVQSLLKEVEEGWSAIPMEYRG